MIRRPPRSTRTDTLFPYTTLFRSSHCDHFAELLLASRLGHYMIGPDGSDEMQFNLGQRGRSLMDFEVSARQTAARLHQRVEGELADRGITAETLPDDMEARHRLIDEALADSPLYQARALLGEWCAKQHGRAAEQAFDEIRDDILPEIEALRRGGTTIAAEDFAPPRYWSETWFHRTHGGWDASDYNGFVNGEIVHKK